MTDTLTGNMMSEEDYLKHYGVKGMKWGVLRDQAAAGNKKAIKTLDKADRDWDKELRSTTGWVKVNNAVADKMNSGGIDKFNANPKYAKIKDFTDDSDPKVKEYFEDYAKLSEKVWNDTMKEVYPESPSGRYKMESFKDEDGNAYMDVVDTKALSHADDVKKRRVYLQIDSRTGRILGIKPVGTDGEVKHSDNQKGNTMTDQLTGMMSEEDFLKHINATPDMSEDEFLEHFGVKGMKWGQSKAADSGPSQRQLNKESRAKDRSERDATIDAARERINSGQNRQAYKDAKATYKVEKKVVGRREAKKAFDAVKAKNVEDYNNSNLAKSGKETVTAVLLAVTGAALYAYANS